MCKGPSVVFNERWEPNVAENSMLIAGDAKKLGILDQLEGESSAKAEYGPGFRRMWEVSIERVRLLMYKVDYASVSLFGSKN